MKLRALAAITVLVAACTPAKPPETAPVPPPKTVQDDNPGLHEPPLAPVNPWALPAQLAEETLPDTDAPVGDPERPVLPALSKDIPKAPKTCDAWIKRSAPKKAAVCADRKAALAALDEAFTDAKPEGRDAKLAALESCATLPAGIVRALRVDLAPVECGDAMIEPVLKGSTFAPVIHQTLIGQALAARASRTSVAPPTMKPPFDKAHVLEFVKGPATTWVKTENAALDELMTVGAKLGFYGRAIAAIEAGIAEARFVEIIRAMPIPDEFKKDAELSDAYYGSLDQVLEPWKARAKDATLIGLRDFATVGAINDSRVARARASLAKMYGGRHVDSLDGLLLPASAATTPASVDARLAAVLPTFYAGQLLDPALVTDVAFLRALVKQGVPLPERRALAKLRGDPNASAETKQVLALARIALGQRFFRAVDFDEATALAAPPTPVAAGTTPVDDAHFTYALALALRGGPNDLVDLMRKAPVAPLGMGATGALDAVSKSPSPNAAIAAEDAALILSISPPDGADVGFFQDVAKRFHAAAAQLTDPGQKATAEKFAKAADDLAAAIAKAPPPKP